LAPSASNDTFLCEQKACFGASASYLCGFAAESEKQTNLKLSTKDLLALAPMKNAAKREM